MLFVSGQAPRDRDGNVVGAANVGAQCVQVYANINAVVEAAGGAMTDVVDTTVIVTDNAHKPTHTGVRHRYFSRPYPSRTMIAAKFESRLHG